MALALVPDRSRPDAVEVAPKHARLWGGSSGLNWKESSVDSAGPSDTRLWIKGGLPRFALSGTSEGKPNLQRREER